MKLLRNMMALIVVLTVMAVAAGCKKSQNYVSQMQSLEKKACECKDKACGETALNEYKAIYEDMNKTNARGTDEELEKIKELSANISKCIIMSGITPQQVLSIFK